MLNKISPLHGIAFLIVLISMGGCVAISSPSGWLQVSLEVEYLFEAGTLLSDHTYYTEGSEIEPDAIIAISNDYHLQTQIWTKREWTAQNLEKAVYWMQSEELGFCSNDGGVLIAPDGKQVGIWYSKKGITTIRESSPGIVEVFPFRYRTGSSCWRQAKQDDL